MKRMYFYASLIILSSGCAPKADFLVISKLIYKEDTKNMNSKLIKRADNARKSRLMAFQADSTKFLKGELNDTTYVIELFNSESASFYGNIWNKNHKMHYSYIQEKFKFDYSPSLSEYETKLILKWDTVTIRKREAAGQRLLDNNTSFKVTRCVKKNNTFRLERIRFDAMLDPEYDSLK